MLSFMFDFFHFNLSSIGGFDNDKDVFLAMWNTISSSFSESDSELDSTIEEEEEEDERYSDIEMVLLTELSTVAVHDISSWLPSASMLFTILVGYLIVNSARA